MDSTIDAREAARRLGVAPSRVLRACRSGRLEGCRRTERGWRLDHRALRVLRERWGAVPSPPPGHRPRNDMLVLAALVRRPRGLPSARAVAAATGLAPTTASRTLRRLHDQGLVERVVEMRLLRGRSRPMEVWYARLLDPEVQALLDDLNRVELPAASGTPTVPARLPDHLWHLAWNADPLRVRPDEDAGYLAHRVLATADPEGTAWAARRLPAAAWSEAARMRGVSARDRAWAGVVADERARA